MLKIIGDIQDSYKSKKVDELILFFNKNYPYVEGEAYKGYPIYIEEFSNKKICIDLALITKRGVYIINILENKVTDYSEIQEEIYLKVDSKLRKHRALIEHRKLSFSIYTITFCEERMEEIEDAPLISTVEGINTFLSRTLLAQDMDDSKYFNIISGIQEAYCINNFERRDEIKEGTKAFYIQQLGKSIDKHDESQMEAILSDKPGIQRIRGMAGSGKTIILARKAVELHIAHPDWNIVIVYSTRSLKKQLEFLINKFYAIRNDGAKIDATKLRIMQTWGGANTSGLYYEICLRHHVSPFNLNDAKMVFRGYENLFVPVCKHLLTNVKTFEPMYDCILIDEAQDFDKNFFNLCYKVLKKDKRLIYAYDELQALNEESMPTPKELFGVDEFTDTPLTVCYRNQSKTIVTAHAIGMGLYRNGETIMDRLIQIPDINVWEVIGYKSDTEIQEGKRVVLKRDKQTSPDYLGETNHELIDFNLFETKRLMYENLLENIENDLTLEQLRPKDILIIDMDIYSYSSNANALLSMKYDNDKYSNIAIHTAGASNPEDFFRDDSIVYSSIRRAKGNEAYMVYIINAQNCISHLTKRSDRNALFTAITRSKGWTRVLGYGTGMSDLCNEFNKIKENDFKLVFDPYPTADQQKELIINSRDVSDKQASNMKSMFDAFKKKGFSESEILQDLLKETSKEEIIKILEELKNDK